MKKIDHYLLTRYPVLWQSRIHVVFALWIVYAICCALAGNFSTIDTSHNGYYKNNDENSLGTMLFLISIVGMISYFIFLTRYNHFKWFGQGNFLTPAYNFLLIFACLSMINSGYPIYHFFKWNANPNELYGNFGDLSFSTIYYITLHQSIYIFIFRHVKGRQFVIGSVLAGVACICILIMLALGRAHDEFMFVFMFLAVVGLIVSIIIARTSSNNFFSMCLVFYHSFLPYIILSMAGKRDYGMFENSYHPQYNWMIDETKIISFVITLALIVFISGPSLRLQWGREE